MQGVIFVDHILVRNLLIMMWQRNQVDLFLYYCRNFQVSLWRSPNRSYCGTRCHPQKYLGFYNQEAIFQISFASNTIFRPTLPQMQSQPLKFCLLLLLIQPCRATRARRGTSRLTHFGTWIQKCPQIFTYFSVQTLSNVTADSPIKRYNLLLHSVNWADLLTSLTNRIWQK